MSVLEDFECAMPAIRGMNEHDLNMVKRLCLSAIEIATEEIVQICENAGHRWDNENGGPEKYHDGGSIEIPDGYDEHGIHQYRTEYGKSYRYKERRCLRCGRVQRIKLLGVVQMQWGEWS